MKNLMQETPITKQNKKPKQTNKKILKHTTFSSKQHQTVLLFLLLFLLLIIILIVAVGNLLWSLRVEMWRLDLADGPSQLVTFTLHLFQVNIVAVPRSQWRLCVYEADVSMLHRGLMGHLGKMGDKWWK